MPHTYKLDTVFDVAGTTAETITLLSMEPKVINVFQDSSKLRIQYLTCLGYSYYFVGLKTYSAV